MSKAERWRFEYLDHDSGIVSGGPGIFAAFPLTGPAYSFVVKATRGHLSVFGYGHTDLEAMKDAIKKAEKYSEPAAPRL